MTSRRWVFISPHLDDAALSCGGLISHLTSKGDPCVNITLTTGIPNLKSTSVLVEDIQREWGIIDPADAVATRKIEDLKSMRTLSCDSIHLDQLDAIYRQSPEGEFLYSSIFDPIHPLESELPTKIADLIKNQLGLNDQLVFPLAIGGHVDHVITHAAAGFFSGEVLYYIDVPYCFKSNLEADATLEGYEPIFFPLNEENAKAWVKAIMCYPSQISSLFKDEQDMTMKIMEYFSQKKGIILLRKGS